jgi:lipopolysaccharide biosynthesis protein
MGVSARLLRPLASARRSIGQIKRRSSRILLRFSGRRDNEQAERVYLGAASLGQRFARTPGVSVAVVVHLYYPEMWELLLSRLRVVDPSSYDLYVTVTTDKSDAARRVLASCSAKTSVVEVPNRGRDVLPFMKLGPTLAALGYQSVLKLHTKRSTHWDGGEKWLNDLLTGVLPPSPGQIDDVLRTLDLPDTAIVGPANLYVSLPVHYFANRACLLEVLGDVVSREAGRRVDRHPDEYGFFAGTMFWARLDALKSLFDCGYSAASFEPEKGQVDGTMAHGLERALCVVPELAGRKLYVSTGVSIRPIEHRSGTIPAWSELHPAMATR